MRVPGLIACLVFLMLSGSCSKRHSTPQLIVEIPPGFSGDFVIEMGVRNAPALPKKGDSYIVAVTRDGRLETSTSLENPTVTFKNQSGGSIWGYSRSLFTTGDGISVGGKIEFFVGTQKDYDADQIKKNHSNDFRLQGSKA